MESTVPSPPLQLQLFPPTSASTSQETQLPIQSTLPALPPHLPQELLKELTVPKVMNKGKALKAKQMTGTNWFLTFPQTNCPKELAKERLLTAQRIQIKGFMIAQEQHQDGNHHLHIGLWLHKKATVPPNYFDFVVGKHGNYLRMRSGYGTVNYLTKEDTTPISYGLVPVPGSAVAKEQTANKKAMKSQSGSRSKSNLSITITTAIQSGCSEREVHDIDPGYFLREKRKIQEYITWWASQQANTKSLSWKELTYNGTDVNTRLIVDWLNLNIKKSRAFKQEQLYISGPMNSRKTSLLLKLSEYLRTYEIPMEDFYDLYPHPEPDLLWMDEYKGQKTIQFLNLIAQGAPMTLRIKGAQKMKLKNIPLIVLSNLTIAQCYHKAVEKTPHLVEALQTRFLEITLTEPLDLDQIVWPQDQIVTTSTTESTTTHPPISPVKTTIPDPPSDLELATAVADQSQDPKDPIVGDADSNLIQPAVATSAIAEVASTTNEDIDNMEYFSRKMRQRRREKMAEEEEELPKIRKSKRLTQKNKLHF